MASDKEDFVYFISGDEEIGAPPLLKPSFISVTDSENEVNNENEANEPASAVNPETGEINWDCPCLKSALEPPCGHTFKAAFSCFVSSKTEPKGIDCQELFKAMQECFQAHPEKYGSILADDEDDDSNDMPEINESSDRSVLENVNYKGPSEFEMIRSRKSKEVALESSQEFDQSSNESLSKSKSRLSKSSSNEKNNLSAPNSRWKNFWVRLIAGLVMMSIFTAIILMGHMVVVLLTLLTQIAVFKEVISIAHLQSKERHLKWFRTIAWYFLFATSYFLYGESLLYYCKETLLVDALFYPLAQHHRFISFSIYTIGIVAFVLNLRKGHYKFQFSQLAFTHMILLFVVFQANFIACSIFEGLFWFVFPISLVICNDIMAYFFGFFFGRTPLIKLSPKKTWEGFWGALFSTIIFGFFFSGFLASIPYLICPVKDLAQNYFNFIPCDKVYSVFVSRSYNLGPALSSLSYHIFRIRHKTINIYPIQLHSILFSIFASVIGPFGGFFASGFKRAFKVKDFSDSIPGHGGVTDRVDCQFLMGLFSYVYFISFIKDIQTSVGQILQLAINGLNTDDQIQLFHSLKAYLEGQDLI